MEYETQYVQYVLVPTGESRNMARKTVAISIIQTTRTNTHTLTHAQTHNTNLCHSKLVKEDRTNYKSDCKLCANTFISKAFPVGTCKAVHSTCRRVVQVLILVDILIHCVKSSICISAMKKIWINHQLVPILVILVELYSSALLHKTSNYKTNCVLL